MINLYNLIYQHVTTFFVEKVTRKVITMIVLCIQGISVLVTTILFMGSKKNYAIELKYTWLALEPIKIQFNFLIDSFTILFMMLITIITFVVMLYSISYLSGDAHVTKFLALLGIFCFSMLWLCVSNNLLTLFVGWEGVGLVSFLLISFWGSRNEANGAALKAVFLNRIGDVFLLNGIILTIMQLKASEIFIMNILVPVKEIMSVIVILFCLGACAKSAQLFLHTWLPEATEGPTPVSSLLHSALWLQLVYF